MRIPIQNDLYEISERIKKIDERYRVFFDTDRQKFIVTVENVIVVIPYEELDQRTIDYLYYTRWENADKVIEDVDRHNERLREESLKRAQNEVEDEFSREMRRVKQEYIGGSLPVLSTAK